METLTFKSFSILLPKCALNVFNMNVLLVMESGCVFVFIGIYLNDFWSSELYIWSYAKREILVLNDKDLGPI